MTTWPVVDFRCDQCGELYPLMLPGIDHPMIEVLVGGVTAPTFQRHGPGCTGQVFVKHDLEKIEGEAD